jgi:hypothetical protein
MMDCDQTTMSLAPVTSVLFLIVNHCIVGFSNVGFGILVSCGIYGTKE